MRRSLRTGRPHAMRSCCNTIRQLCITRSRLLDRLRIGLGLGSSSLARYGLPRSAAHLHVNPLPAKLHCHNELDGTIQAIQRSLCVRLGVCQRLRGPASAYLPSGLALQSCRGSSRAEQPCRSASRHGMMAADHVTVCQCAQVAAIEARIAHYAALNITQQDPAFDTAFVARCRWSTSVVMLSRACPDNFAPKGWTPWE